jgi:hypothetical protein
MPLIRVRPPGPLIQSPPGPRLVVSNTLSKRGRDFFEKVQYPKRDDPDERTVTAELRNRITEWTGATSEFLHNAANEFDFLAGQHWIEEETGQDRARQMASEGRSALVIDLLTPSVEIVVNQIRINKTTVNFVPLSEGADKATAEVRQGLYRNIERVSKAAIARETGYHMAVAVGRGYWRIVIEDEDGPTFNRRLAFRRVDNLNSVAIDPTCLDFTYRDAGWAYTFDDVYRDQLREEYGTRADAEGMYVDVDTAGLSLPEVSRNFWFPKDKVKVGEYWRRQWKKRTVWRLADGTDTWSDEAPEWAKDDNRGSVIRVKTKLDPYLEWRKMTGTQTLEKRIWPGTLIPIIVCVGREIFRGKKPKINSGMVRPAMHPSRINDYMTSRMVDEVGLSPLPHLFSYVGQLTPEQKTLVNEINRHPWSNIEVTPLLDDQGRQMPAPQWSSPSPNIAAVVQAATVAKDSLMRVLNTFAPQLGALQADQSGRAIEQVKDQGDVSHAGFPDNFQRALLYEADVMNELMDAVYTEPQVISITEMDESTRNVLINQEYQDEKSGKRKLHLFGGPKYGPVPQTGQPYPTRMAEAANRLLDLARTPALAPEISKIIDLIIQDLNIPNAQKYADRLRPPGFNDPDELPSPQILMEQMQKLQGVNDQAHQLIMQLVAKVNEMGSKEDLERLKIASNERIAAGKDLAGIVEAELAAKQKGAFAVLEAQLKNIAAQLQGGQDVQSEKQEEATDITQTSTPTQPANGAPQPPTTPAPAWQPPPGAPNTALLQ